jgi:hypothetical protein
MDTILAVFLAATMGAGDPHRAANPIDRCEYYVSEAAQQVIYLCEGWPEGDARQPSPQENPPIKHEAGKQGSGASARTIPEYDPTAAATLNDN